MEMKYNWDWSILLCRPLADDPSSAAESGTGPSTGATEFGGGIGQTFDTGAEGAQPYFDWIVSGLGWTVVVAICAWVLTFSIGSVVGVSRTVEIRWVRTVATAYV